MDKGKSYPPGLGALSDRLKEIGMQFGLWFEPEECFLRRVNYIRLIPTGSCSSRNAGPQRDGISLYSIFPVSRYGMPSGNRWT